MADLEKLVEELSSLSVMEAAELVKLLEEKWGVSAAAPVAVAAAVPGAAGAEAQAEEKTEFDVIIEEVGPKKIEVIKAIRKLTQMGLKEAKEAAETPGYKILEQVSKETAEEAKKALEEAGAKVKLA